MSVEATLAEEAKELEVSIHLGVDDKTRHWSYFGATPPAHRSANGGATVSRNVKIHNGRNNSDLTLDDASFELVDCPTALSTADFYRIQEGDQEMGRKYVEEVTALLKAKLGCDEVVFFHSQVRNMDMAGKHGGVQSYAGFMPHTDSSAISGDEFALTMSNGTKYERYLYLNLWRNISEDPIENNHLAMLDERTTVKPDDYIAKDLFMEHNTTVVQYNLNARHAHVHKWYYFPRMKKNEGILFKQMDSDWTKTSRCCFHMSVSDPNAAENAKTRESIEARFICFWKKAAVDSMPTKENLNVDLIERPDELVKKAVDSASVWDLTMALIGKIPIVGRYLSSTPTAYSGNPADYFDKFHNAVRAFSSWPKAGIEWAKGEMKKAVTAEKGIANITTVIVADALGYSGTKLFKSSEKEAIVTHLLANKEYMATAKKVWGSLRDAE